MMATDNMARPRATILMTTRERHALTESALDSIARHTARPFRLIYAGIMAPDWLRERLAKRAKEQDFEVLHFDEPLWPHEVRRRLAGMIDTDYVVYIDNDVEVEPGWLDKLVACADETGAGVVGPLYLWGDGVAEPRIHMAGGQLIETPEGESRVLDEKHKLYNTYPREVADQLYRQPCDFLEYHCMLIRSELMRDGSLFDENILCAHEHIDTALTARQRGYPVYFEPDSRITYLAFAEYRLEDLPLFRKRWAMSAGEDSIRAFADKWNVIDDERSFGGLRKFLARHVSQTDPIRPGADAFNDQDAAMAKHELAQSRSDLLDQAAQRGYGDEALAQLAKAWRLMQTYMNASYRPCGRPFINHLVGTASVLIRYGFRLDIVLAGLMHTIYTHRPQALSGPAGTQEASRLLGGPGKPVEKRVRAYSLRGENGLSDMGDANALTVFDAEIVAIAAANEIDMHLSGEYRYTRRSHADQLPQMQMIEHVCQLLGVPGLHATLAQASRNVSAVPDALKTVPLGSYRIKDGAHARIRCELPEPEAFAHAPAAPMTQGHGHPNKLGQA
jgi:GT2 family glycosyltransferase